MLQQGRCGQADGENHWCSNPSACWQVRVTSTAGVGPELLKGCQGVCSSPSQCRRAVGLALSWGRVSTQRLILCFRHKGNSIENVFIFFKGKSRLGTALQRVKRTIGPPLLCPVSKLSDPKWIAPQVCFFHQKVKEKSLEQRPDAFHLQDSVML